MLANTRLMRPECRLTLGTVRASPSPGKPSELTRARFSVNLTTRGFGLPVLSANVIVPPVTNPNPKSSNAPRFTQFLSKPAANPMGEGIVNPAMSAVNRGSSNRANTPGAFQTVGTRIASEAAAWARSGSSVQSSGLTKWRYM